MSNRNAVDVGKGCAGGLEKVEWGSMTGRESGRRVGSLVAEINRGRIHSGMDRGTWRRYCGWVIPFSKCRGSKCIYPGNRKSEAGGGGLSAGIDEGASWEE